jgi:hypothetical protein
MEDKASFQQKDFLEIHHASCEGIEINRFQRHLSSLVGS